MDPFADLTYLPVAQWPDEDQRAWASAHVKGTYFTKGGRASEWATSTHERCEAEYGRLLLYFARHGLLKPVTRVGQRVTNPKPLTDFLDWLCGEIAPKSVVAALGHISQTVRALDEHADRTLLLRARSRLARTAKPVRKIDDQLLPPRELWELGLEMMQEAESNVALSVKHRAILYRDGLLIAFLALCPLRRRNAVALRDDEHLEVLSGSTALTIPAEQYKSRKEFNATLPQVLMERIRTYWNDFRPALAWRPDTDKAALWVTMRGTVMAADTMSDRIERILWERKERRFSSHMFRHSAATFIADISPKLALLAVGVLGHSSYQTAHDHYIRSQQTRAVTQYQDEVLAIIEGAGGVAEFDFEFNW
jgi:integrase/recombinase XerD